MPAYDRPGHYVEESLLPVNPAQGPQQTVVAFVGTAERGFNTPTKVTSWSQYAAKFGAFEASTHTGIPTHWLPYAVHQYFANGGGEAIITRVVDTTAGTAALTLNDRQGVPAATISVAAAWKGANGTKVYVEVVAGSTPDASDPRFGLVVYYGGSAASNEVERWSNLSMDTADDRYFERIVNDSLAGSNYIRLTDQNSPATGGNDRPAVTAAAPLTGASLDGSTPVIDAADYEPAWKQLDEYPDASVLVLPGVTASATINLASTYCQTRGDMFLVADAPKGNTPADVVTYYNSLSPTSSHAALYYPWLTISDPSVQSRTATKLVPPSGAIAGIYARTDLTRGPFKAPAGLEARVAGAVGLERRLTNANLATLNASHVNAVRSVPGEGIVVWGTRTLRKTLQADKYVPVRRSLIHIRRNLMDLTEFAVFEPNDKSLWARLASVCQTFLHGYWQQGGLFGATSSDAFYVKCDADLNTPDKIAQGIVTVEAGVAVQFPAEFVVLRIGQIQGGGNTAAEL